jgi:hypothetical protein
MDQMGAPTLSSVMGRNRNDYAEATANRGEHSGEWNHSLEHKGVLIHQLTPELKILDILSEQDFAGAA